MITTGLALFDHATQSHGKTEHTCFVDTQCGMVLRYMREEGSITPLEAMREFGIMRLSGRIYDLKTEGHDIVAETEESVNRYGKTIRYAKYRLNNTRPKSTRHIPSTQRRGE